MRKMEAASNALAVKEGWQRCPGCTALVEKTTGCNHMKHKGCPLNALSEEIRRHLAGGGSGSQQSAASVLIGLVSGNSGSAVTTHFCYCCGELLLEHCEEVDGTVHFPNGVFNNCRKKKKRKALNSDCRIM